MCFNNVGAVGSRGSGSNFIIASIKHKFPTGLSRQELIVIILKYVCPDTKNDNFKGEQIHGQIAL